MNNNDQSKTIITQPSAQERDKLEEKLDTVIEQLKALQQQAEPLQPDILSLDQVAEYVPPKKPTQIKEVATVETVNFARERTRRELANKLVNMLSYLVIGSFAILVTDRISFMAKGQQYQDNQSKELITLIWTGIIGIVGTALGFYFGHATATGEDNRNNS